MSGLSNFARSAAGALAAGVLLALSAAAQDRRQTEVDFNLHSDNGESRRVRSDATTMFGGELQVHTPGVRLQRAFWRRHARGRDHRHDGREPYASIRTVLSPGARPDPPKRLKASNGNGQVTLTWKAPYGNADITRHEYRSKTTGDYPAEWTEIDNSAPGGDYEDWVVVTGLANDTDYTFELRAVNADGAGLSAETGPVTPKSGFCGRTEAVRDALLIEINTYLSYGDELSDCSQVSRSHLSMVYGRVYVSRVGLKSLQPDDFSGLTALGALYLDGNELRSLPYGVFSDLAALWTLDLRENELRSLPADVFSGLTALGVLELGHNEFGSLPAGVFSSLTELGQLVLAHNELRSLPAGVFSGLTELWKLHLTHNELGSLPAGVFSGLTVLTQLSLADNELGSLPDGVFSGLTALSFLDLGHNELGSLPAGVFSSLRSLRWVYLENNKLRSLPDGLFSVLTDVFYLDHLYLHENTVDPLPLTVTLEKVGSDQVRAVVPVGVPYRFDFRVKVRNGALEGGAKTLHVREGKVESTPVTVYREAGTTAAVTVDVLLTRRYRPRLPGRHYGYDFFRASSGLPVEILPATGGNAAPAFTSSEKFARDEAREENETSVGTLVAEDADEEDDIEGYAITGGADGALFEIGRASGALSFRTAPNYEDPRDAGEDHAYEVTVEATSGTEEREKTVEDTITVTVRNVLEPPGRPDAPNVSAASSTSLRVTWTAPDNTGPAIWHYDVRYRAGTSGSWSYFRGDFPSIATSAVLAGLSENTSYQVGVLARNDEGMGGWSPSGTGRTDANAAPHFTSPDEFDGDENGTSAGRVAASDSDSEDDIEGYAITGGADRAFFEINGTSGVLRFRAAPNFEDPRDSDGDNDYLVTVEATSGKGERERTAEQTVTVTVADVGGEAPGRPDDPEVSAASVSSLAVAWSAPDNEGPAITDYDVRYRAGTSGGWSDGGHAGTATSATLTGLAENTAYQVQVRATNDEGTGAWSPSGTGRTDANAAPYFTSPDEFDADENETSAGRVAAADNNSEDDIEGYAITGGADRALFSIGATDGALRFRASPNFEDPRDADGDNDYLVTVEATSGTGERERTAEQTITVTVEDVGGEAPGRPDDPEVSAASVSSLAVAWSAPDNAGPAITDYDVRYRAGTTGDWSDGSHAGTATTATLAGLSENTSYQVQVRATNDEGTGAWSPSGTGRTDANAAPYFTSRDEFGADENGTSAGRVAAADSDSEDDIEGYAITGGADGALFSIGATDGALRFRAAPNFEDPRDADGDNDYLVTVEVTSGKGEREKTAEQTIRVTVEDVGGEAPGTPDAPEVSAASATSLRVAWSAPDNEGPAITDYDVRYRPDTGAGFSYWEHDGTATTATLTGLSENTTYHVQVRATNDEGTGARSQYGIGRTDANAAPSFTSPDEFGADENGTSAGRVAAADSDSEDDIEGYAITGGADRAFFEIDGTSGALRFRSAPNFEDPRDSDGDNDYLVTVEATSGKGEREKTAEQTITVTVADVGGEAPGRPGDPEVSAASATSLRVTWTAPDNTGPAITDYDVRYRAGGGWSDGGHDGTATSATLTGLAENTAYQVQVRATNDEGTGAWSPSGTGRTDANAAPSFTSPDEFDADENGTSAGRVAAADSDSEDDIEGYAITGGADRAFFEIDGTSGVLRFRSAPNFEDPRDSDGDNDYLVTVEATSGKGEREKTAEQTITVTVADVGGEAPGRPGDPEVSAASATSLRVTWTAPDNTGPAITDYDVRYRAGGGWSDGGHDGTATSATLTGLAENTAYQVQVRATNDEGTGAWSPSGTGRTDANAAPSFTSPDEFDADENGTSAGRVAAADSDSEDDIEGYAITGGADRAFFEIDGTSGVLRFGSAPNFEDPRDSDGDNDYLVTVEATSGKGERERTAEQTITVTVADVGGEAPGRPGDPEVSAASATSLRVTWTAPDNTGPAITDYDVRYRAGGGWSDGGHDGTATSATLTGLAENTAYQVQVRATNDEGTGAWSPSGTGRTDANAAPSFTSPDEFDADENGTSAGRVAAADSDSEDDIEGYAITGGADRAFFEIDGTSGVLRFGSAPNFEDPRDSDGDNDYLVTVEATSGKGERERTAEQTITVTVADVGGEAPGRPGDPEVSAASATSLAVAWSAPDNEGPAITDYDMRYRAGTSGGWSDGGHDGTATSATLTGLAENTAYQVQVRATNDEGTGAWSPSGTGTTSSEGICDRTPRIRDRILVLLKNRHSYKGDCSGVTGEHLAKPKSLDVSRNMEMEQEFTMSLKEHDFEGLVNLEKLYMRDTGLRSLPAGVFDGLAKLEELELNKNKLESLPAGVFSDLESLQMLKLRNNPSLESLPYDELEALPELTGLSVDLAGRRKLQVAGGEDDAALEVPEGGSATYELRLMATTNAKAANPVKVTVSSSDESVVTASPATVSFTRENWFRRQTVTVSAEETDSETTAELTHAAAGAYYAYDKLPLPGVTVTVLEAEEYRAPGEEDEEDPFTRPCSALAGGDGLTPAAAAAALWEDGEMSDDRLAALDSLGNGNGRYDLGDLLAWLARCRRGEGPGPAARAAPASPAPPSPPPALPSSRPGRAGRRRSGGRGPARRRTSCRTRRPPPVPRPRRSGWLPTALLVAATSAWGCGLGDGIAGPRDDAPRDGQARAAVVDPGPLHVRLTAPAGARDIGAMLVLEGPAIDSLRAPGLELFERDASSPTRREVVIGGALSPDGPLLRVWVPHRGSRARYRVKLLQVAGEDFTLRDLTAYGTVISR